MESLPANSAQLFDSFKDNKALALKRQNISSCIYIHDGKQHRSKETVFKNDFSEFESHLPVYYSSENVKVSGDKVSPVKNRERKQNKNKRATRLSVKYRKVLVFIPS